VNSKADKDVVCTDLYTVFLNSPPAPHNAHVFTMLPTLTASRTSCIRSYTTFKLYQG